MTLFTKKEKIILNSELQRDDFIEKLDKVTIPPAAWATEVSSPLLMLFSFISMN